MVESKILAAMPFSEGIYWLLSGSNPQGVLRFAECQEVLQERVWKSQRGQGPPIPSSLLTKTSLKWRRKNTKEEKQAF